MTNTSGMPPMPFKMQLIFMMACHVFKTLAYYDHTMQCELQNKVKYFNIDIS